MKNAKTWAEIDAAPVLLLPPEERARLKETRDDRFSAFWADCFGAMYPAGDTRAEKAKAASEDPNKNDAEDIAVDAFCKAFFQVFTTWEPKPGQPFHVYLLSAVKNERNHIRLENGTFLFGRETNRKVKKAQDYMARFGISETKLLHDEKTAQTVAKLADISVKTLREALQNKQALLSLDDPGEGDSTLGDRLADERENVEQQAEPTGAMLQWLRRGIGLMDLSQKEKYGKSEGPLWSSVLLGYLRNEDVLPPAEDAPDRLAHCDDLRGLEQDNCLWDILLLRSYVDFTVCPPHVPRELERAALNALLQADRNPAQDKTVAAFLGVSKAAVSQRRKTWQKKLLQMKAEQEER